MTLYDDKEIERIEKVKTSNDKMEEYFNSQKEEWNKRIEPLLMLLKTD